MTHDLSIVTVTKNDYNNLSLTLNNISDLSELFPELLLQHIIVDGSPAPNGDLKTISLHTNTVTFLRDQGKGIYDAMNSSHSFIDSTWTIFLNSGDTLNLELDWTEIITTLKLLIDSPYDYIIGSTAKLYPNSRKKTIRSKSLDNLHKGSCFSHQSVITRTISVINHPFELRYKYASDYHHFLSAYLSKPNSFYFIDACLSFFTSHGASDTNRLSVVKEWIYIQRELLNKPSPYLRNYLLLLQVSLPIWKTIQAIRRMT